MSRIVLCVDDDPDDRELIRNAIFKIDPSFTVADATNGKEALQYLTRAERSELPCLEDDPDDRELIRNAIFKIDPSFTVADATNGKEALQYLTRAERSELPCL